jgi:hypothetical protein
LENEKQTGIVKNNAEFKRNRKTTPKSTPTKTAQRRNPLWRKKNGGKESNFFLVFKGKIEKQC